MSLRLDGLEIPEWASAPPGQPLSLPLAAIDEDPDQPRIDYEPEALQQLADTIAERGVRQAISVRTHPHEPGRWMLNFGSRRLRASRLAGKREIPAFIDETADSYDQVIENEQREGLKPLELAMFVQRRLKAGSSQADVARRLGKSRAYITYVCAMIDPPDCVMQAYREGKCRGVSELYELRKLHEQAPGTAARLLEGTERLSRRDLVESRSQHATLLAPAATGSKLGERAPMGRLDGVPRAAGPSTAAASGSSIKPHSFAPIAATIEVTGEVDGERCRVVLDRVPDDASQILVLDPGGLERSVFAVQVVALRLCRT